MNKQFKGTGVALVTPFKEDGGVDYKGLEKLVEHLISGGVNYLVVQGTTGESVTLTAREKAAVLEFVRDSTGKRVPLVYGHGGSNTRQLVDAFDELNLTGVDAILSVSPYYNKPTQEGIYQHYKTLAEASPVPVILYNVPGRTGSNMTAETTLRLAHDVKNIIAVKEASGDLEQTSQISRDRPEDFLVISGDDALTLPLMAVGGDGVISVVANAFPKEFSEMMNFCLKGDYTAARKIHLKLLEVTRLLFAEGNPGGIKAALKILGLCGDKMRLPLVNISGDTYKKLEKAMGR